MADTNISANQGGWLQGNPYSTSDPWQVGGIWYGNQYSSAESIKSDARSLEMAKQAQQFSSAEAQKQRDYESQMSNTAVSRRMADLKAAGVNPALAYAQGDSSASTPSGASAQAPSGRSSGGGRESFTPLLGTALAILGKVALSSISSASVANARGAMPLLVAKKSPSSVSFNSRTGEFTKALGSVSKVNDSPMSDAEFKKMLEELYK